MTENQIITDEEIVNEQVKLQEEEAKQNQIQETPVEIIPVNIQKKAKTISFRIDNTVENGIFTYMEINKIDKSKAIRELILKGLEYIKKQKDE